jgi:hypothetical protein
VQDNTEDEERGIFDGLWCEEVVDCSGGGGERSEIEERNDNEGRREGGREEKKEEGRERTKEEGRTHLPHL